MSDANKKTQTSDDDHNCMSTKCGKRMARPSASRHNIARSNRGDSWSPIEFTGGYHCKKSRGGSASCGSSLAGATMLRSPFSLLSERLTPHRAPVEPPLRHTAAARGCIRHRRATQQDDNTSPSNTSTVHHDRGPPTLTHSELEQSLICFLFFWGGGANFETD